MDDAAGVGAAAGADGAAEVEADGDVAVDVDFHAAAEVGDEVAVAAECVAAGAEQAAAEEDKGDDAGERELGDEVAAGGEEEGAGVVLCHGVDDGDGAECALELGAEEAQREVGEAQAEGRGGGLVGAPELLAVAPGVALLVGVEELVRVRGGEQDAGEDAELEGVALGRAATDPLEVAAVLTAGRLGGGRSDLSRGTGRSDLSRGTGRSDLSRGTGAAVRRGRCGWAARSGGRRRVGAGERRGGEGREGDEPPQRARGDRQEGRAGDDELASSHCVG
jgi:hypothetical protein